MIYFDSPFTEPSLNLAVEEYLMKESGEEVFMLWQNNPCIIYGKHQNPQTEIDLSLCREKRIPVLRRSSGGGTVYQDLGNFNLTFIQNNSSLTVSPFLQLIRNFLWQFGLSVRSDARNALFIGNAKISGSAQWIYKHRFLYHATLLFSSDLSLLSRTLQPIPSSSTIFESPKVKSVKSPVTNIQDHLLFPLSCQEFRKQLSLYFIPNTSKNYKFSTQKRNKIRQLQKNYKDECTRLLFLPL